MSPRRFTPHILLVALVAIALPLATSGSAAAARVKTIKVTDASVIEGDGSSKTLAFTVSWSGSKGGGGVQVGYATADATATAGTDYTAKSGTVGLSNGGCRCATVSIAVLGDVEFEGTEAFQLNLSNPVNGIIGDPQGLGTIYDNEGPPTLIAGDASADESAGTLVMTVVLTSTVPGGTTVNYTTADSSASGGADYTSKTGTLAFSSSQTSKTVTVSISNDALSEDDETFTLDLSNASGASVTDAQGLATINDDDVDPEISVADVSVTEGDSGSATASFGVSLSSPAGREIAVDFTTADATALNGADYVAGSATLTVPAGQTLATIDVPVDGDAIFEGDETFSLALSAPVNVTIADGTAIGTITDDDPPPAFSIEDLVVDEGDAGSTTATFTVTAVGDSALPSSVEWATAGVTATAGADYQDGSGVLSFPAGSVSATIEVTINGDLLDEPDEGFEVILGNPVKATVVDGTGQGTVHDDDKTPTVLTERMRKTTKSLRVNGTIESAAVGMKISLTLLKKKGVKFVKVAAKNVTVKTIGDADADSFPDAPFRTVFKRPVRGSYEVVARYLGDAEFSSSSRKIKFKI